MDLLFLADTIALHTMDVFPKYSPGFRYVPKTLRCLWLAEVHPNGRRWGLEKRGSDGLLLGSSD